MKQINVKQITNVLIFRNMFQNTIYETSFSLRANIIRSIQQKLYPSNSKTIETSLQ